MSISDNVLSIYKINISFQYGWSMSQKLPVGSFRWVYHLTREDILKWDPESDIGYYLEVDCRIPVELHDFLNDMPLFPDSMTITNEMASAYTRHLREMRFGKGYRCSDKKLAPSMLDKKRYKCHIAALQLYMKLGNYKFSNYASLL